MAHTTPPPTYAHTRCVFQRPPLWRYRQVLANYTDEWEAADKAKRVDHLRYVWRQRVGA